MTELSPDEELYLEQLCAGPKSPSEIAIEIQQDSAINKSHPSSSIKDRLDDLADDSKFPDVSDLVKWDKIEGFELTEKGRKEICES